MDIEKVVKEFYCFFENYDKENPKCKTELSVLSDWLRQKLIEAKKETIADFDMEFGNNKVIKEYCERKIRKLGE